MKDLRKHAPRAFSPLPQAKDVGFVIYRMISPNTPLSVRLIIIMLVMR